VRVVSAVRGAALAPLPWEVSLERAKGLLAEFQAAHLRPLALLRATDLDAHAEPRGHVRIWLALESLQVTGSFKVRGALAALLHAKEIHGDAVHVMAASAGNHGAGVAYAAQALGLKATVVVPEAAPEAKRARIRAYGAELAVFPSPFYDDAEAHAIARAKDEGAVFISAYDDPWVATGNGGTLGLEIAAALGHRPAAVLCPVGGGGLASGLGWALSVGGDREDGETTQVWGVQSEASPALARSLETGRAVTRLTEESETLAEGLEGGISERAFERVRRLVAGVVVVGERKVAAAMSFAHKELGLVLEGSAAVSLVPVLNGLPEALVPQESSADIVVVLTGRNVDRERLLRLPHADG
jgi:threonine dehydratase